MSLLETWRRGRFWQEPPPPQLLNTFRVAAGLKLVGTAVAISLGYVLVGRWHFVNWSMALVTGTLLMLWLLPWPQWVQPHSQRLMHTQLILALIFAIIAPQLDLWHSSHVPFEPLLANPRFVDEINWTQEQINSVYALGGLFTMVPVVLASWQYGRFGMWLSLALSGLLYTITPFFLPPDAFTWGIYAIRGFVLLGVTLILAYTVATLATAQRREQAALATANQKLAEQAVINEQLATSRERNRLARELHDTLAHSLSGTAVQLQAVATLLKLDPPAAAAELAEAQQQIRRGLEESRRAIGALRASPLEEMGLTAALQERGERLAGRMGLPLQAEISDQLPPLSPLVEQSLYRIADEALLNIERHAQASRIEVSLGLENGRLHLTISDDGQGFNVQQMAAGNNGRFGLLGMKERAALIDADLEIESRNGEGTVIRLAVATMTTTN
jgi:signal transduction histidine kinase